MRHRKSDQQNQPEEKFLDVSASMQGSLRFDDPVNLRINGRFEGELHTKGVLMIGKSAHIKADINGESVSITGIVKGNIKTTTMLHLEEGARLTGNIITPALVVAEGAVINGHITMTAASDKNAEEDVLLRGDWMTLDQLAKYLEVDEDKINTWAKGGSLPGIKEGEKWIFERTKIDQWISEGRVKK